jgi:hypothetical protein
MGGGRQHFRERGAEIAMSTQMSTTLLFALGFGGFSAGLLFLIDAARKYSGRRA